MKTFELSRYISLQNLLACHIFYLYKKIAKTSYALVFLSED